MLGWGGWGGNPHFCSPASITLLKKQTDWCIAAAGDAQCSCREQHPLPERASMSQHWGWSQGIPCIPKSMHPCAWGAHRRCPQLRDGAYCCVIPPESGEGCTDSPWQVPLAAKIAPWMEELGGHPVVSNREQPPRAIPLLGAPCIPPATPATCSLPKSLSLEAPGCRRASTFV